MALSTRVMVNGITNLHDARYCAGMGVEFIGFPLHSEEMLPPETVNEIIGWLSGVSFIAEVRSSYPLEKGAYNVQYFMTEEYDYVNTLAIAQGLPIIYKKNCKANAVESALEEMRTLKSIATFFVLVIDEVGEATLQKIKNNRLPIFIASSFNEETVQKTIEVAKPEGIAIYAESKEIKIGLNDLNTLADVLEAIELDD